MSDEQLTPRERRLKIAEAFTRKVGLKEARRFKGKTQQDHTIWFGLGMFGVVGWSVAIPTLIFTAIGLWIDRDRETFHPETFDRHRAETSAGTAPCDSSRRHDPVRIPPRHPSGRHALLY